MPGREVAGLYGYLRQIFESYREGSIGEFLTEDVRATVSGDEREPRREITLGRDWRPTTWGFPRACA